LIKSMLLGGRCSHISWKLLVRKAYKLKCRTCIEEWNY
jgi:hypothetical protein